MITERTMREGLIDLCRHDQERLVKMALAKLHVSKFHRHYDDFYQEGCIAYARAYVAFKGSVDAECDRFYAFAYKLIYWRMLDLLKKSWHQEDERQVSTDASPATAYHLAAMQGPWAAGYLTNIENRQQWASLMRALCGNKNTYPYFSSNFPTPKSPSNYTFPAPRFTNSGAASLPSPTNSLPRTRKFIIPRLVDTFCRYTTFLGKICYNVTINRSTPCAVGAL